MKIVRDVRSTAHTPFTITPPQKNYQLIKSVCFIAFILDLIPVIHEIAELNHIL